MDTTDAWLPWALASAVFAALTAVTAKSGLEGIDSDFATLLRTAMIAMVLGVLVAALGKWRDPFARAAAVPRVSRPVSAHDRGVVGVPLPRP